MANIPACIAKAFDDLPHPTLRLPDGKWYVVGATPPCKRIIRFFAGKNQRYAASTMRMWDAVSRLTGDGEPFEFEAARLLGETVESAPGLQPSGRVLTRAALRDLDSKVVEAAGKLIAALVNHPELIGPPSSRYWPPRREQEIRRTLNGVQLTWHGGFIQIGEPIPNPEDPNFAAWVIANEMPTMVQLLEGLRNEASGLRVARMSSPKVRQSGDVHLLRGLLRGLIKRHPSAGASHLAAVAAPIVEFFFDGDFYERAEKMAQRMLSRSAH